MPEEIAKKINKDPNLFKEFKLFTCKLQSIKSKQSNRNLWTFPEYKGSMSKKSGPKQIEINFPDPKFYMIGFTLSTIKKSHNLDHSSYTSVDKDESSLLNSAQSKRNTGAK